jgi:site-specific DNA recombinase
METKQIKKAVLYCRVSTKEQVEEGNSLVTQEKNCKEYAMKNGYEIVAVFIEQGESAKTVDRTELKKLMSFCASKKNNVSVVIAYKIDRISRNTDDYSQIRILLKRYGVEIKSTSEFFEDSPAGRFMENIIANVAQFDNDVRAERSIGGMRDAVREGRYVWQAPYGYNNVRINGKSTIAQGNLAPLVKKTFEIIALNTTPAEDVRKQIIAEGLVNSLGKPVSKSLFYRMLRNRVYTGWVTQFGETHKGIFEPLISEELFNRVQWVLSSKKAKNKQYITDSLDFPLRRFFVHPNGQLLTGCWAQGKSKKYPYYRFHKHKINISKSILETKFKELLNRHRIDDANFEVLLKLTKIHLDNSIASKKISVEKMMAKAVDLKTKQALILDKNIEGIISNELCKEKIAEIDNELYKINQSISEFPQTTINYKSLLNIIHNVLKYPGDVWEKSNFKTQIKLQWFFFPDGIIFDGNESRTPKLCMLLKLNEYLLPTQFWKVNHPNYKSNTEIQQISLPSQKNIDFESVEFWDELRKELQTLASLSENCISNKFYHTKESVL